ncbi:MAG: hypothetical protein ACK55Z_19580 [bacterium]
MSPPCSAPLCFPLPWPSREAMSASRDLPVRRPARWTLNRSGASSTSDWCAIGLGR